MINQIRTIALSIKTNYEHSKLLSAFEVLLCAFAIIGHNVFQIIPNEVYILSFIGLLSFKLRHGSLSDMGFKRPKSWTSIVLIALAAAVLRILLGELVISPLASEFWPPAQEAAQATEIVGNTSAALLALLTIWTFAAFGEEISYRGYLLTRVADLGKRSNMAYWIGIIVASILFGYGHYYKGLTGVIDSGFGGLVFGCAYFASGKNLWTSVLAHGFVDTIAVVAIYSGVAS